MWQLKVNKLWKSKTEAKLTQVRFSNLHIQVAQDWYRFFGGDAETDFQYWYVREK